MRKLLITILIITGLFSISAFIVMPDLLSDKDLSEKPLLFSLDEAMIYPDTVFRLCLGGQELKELPDNMGDMKNIHEINLSQNYISKLPDSFCRLIKLKELSLATNELTELPAGFGELRNLKSLDLSTNSKLDWHREINKIIKLENLEYLDLSYNSIDYIPDDIKYLKKLKEFYLLDNNFKEEDIQRLKKLVPGANILAK